MFFKYVTVKIQSAHHLLYNIIVPNQSAWLTKTFVVLYILTVCDMASRFGTKKMVLNAASLDFVQKTPGFRETLVMNGL